MISILYRFLQLDQQLSSLSLAKQNMDEVRRIQERSTEWKTVKAKLERLETSAEILSPTERQAPELVSMRNSVRRQAADIRKRLQAASDVAGLEQDASWRKLLSSVTGLAEQLEKAALETWKKAVEECGSLEMPSTVRALMPPTPENESAARRYDDSFRQFQEVAKRRIPTSLSDLSSLRAHADACRRAYGSITFDVPEDVRVFLKAVQDDSATVAHLTPIVVEWLKEKQQLARYRVRRGPV
jgi:hypothetical protein